MNLVSTQGRTVLRFKNEEELGRAMLLHRSIVDRGMPPKLHKAPISTKYYPENERTRAIYRHLLSGPKTSLEIARSFRMTSSLEATMRAGVRGEIVTATQRDDGVRGKIYTLTEEGRKQVRSWE